MQIAFARPYFLRLGFYGIEMKLVEIKLDLNGKIQLNW